MGQSPPAQETQAATPTETVKSNKSSPMQKQGILTEQVKSKQDEDMMGDDIEDPEDL
jgi:hypothetical protein